MEMQISLELFINQHSYLLRKNKVEEIIIKIENDIPRLKLPLILVAFLILISGLI